MAVKVAVLPEHIGPLLVKPALTGVQVPGAVVTLLVGLDTLVSTSQLQRVSTVMAVVWL